MSAVLAGVGNAQERLEEVVEEQEKDQKGGGKVVGSGKGYWSGIQLRQPVVPGVGCTILLRPPQDVKLLQVAEYKRQSPENFEKSVRKWRSGALSIQLGSDTSAIHNFFMGDW